MAKRYLKSLVTLMVTSKKQILGLAFVAVLGIVAAAFITKPANATIVQAKVVSNVRLLQHAQAGSYYRPFPNGIAPNNAQLAWNQVSDRASWDDQYAAVIAQQTGAAVFNQADYKPLGYRYGMPGTTNSALSGTGQVVGLQDHDGSGSVKMLAVINVHTQKTVAFMVRCGNPRLHQTPTLVVLPWHSFRKETVLYINRQVVKHATITCPSKQKVYATLRVTLHGIVRGSTWGKVKGGLQAHLRVAFNGQVKSVVKLSCGPKPPNTTTVNTTTVQTTTSVTTTTQTTTTVVTTTTSTTTNTTTTTPLQSHFTNLTCQGQEEVTGGGSSLLVCQVSNDNGAQISLDVQVLTNKGNLLVSGIQCSSQGGTPACQGAGTFEIRIGGVNDTSSPIYSDLEVKAASNGVPSAPFDQTYKVDPSGSNFG